MGSWSPDIERRRPDLPLLVDLCSGAGGAAMGYSRVGFEIVGIDVKPQPNYPFQFIQGDATEINPEWLRKTAHAVHCSPPCQYYSITKHRTGRGNTHSALIEPLRDLCAAARVPYIIENVEGAKWALRDPVMLCGSYFGLRVRRHRFFESNRPIIGLPCRHAWQDQNPCYKIYVGKNRSNGRGYKLSGVMPVFGGNHLVGGGQLKYSRLAMGINWMTQVEINESIPPDYTFYLGSQLITLLGV